MSDWCYMMEEALLEAKAVIIDGSYWSELDDQEFYRLLYQLGRMRRGEWVAGQI